MSWTLVPEQRQGSWTGFVVFAVINHSPELSYSTRTFLVAPSLSHPEKQMARALPCTAEPHHKLHRGVSGEARLVQLPDFTRIVKNLA